MRLLVFLLLLAGALAGCIEEDRDQTESVRAFVQAWCDSDVDAALAYTATPFYMGGDGPQEGSRLRQRFAVAMDEAHRNGQTWLHCPERFDFAKLESLTPAAVETRFNVSIAQEIPGYAPAASDRYVLVPRLPNPNSDDPVQGFWRPGDTRWLHVAMFGD